VKPDEDTPPTAPDDPPAAGPDRALDPPPGEPPAAAVVEVALAVVVDGDAVGDDEPQAASPITPHINAAAMIPRLRLLDSNLIVSESFMVAFLSGASRSCVNRPAGLVALNARPEAERTPGTLMTESARRSKR